MGCVSSASDEPNSNEPSVPSNRSYFLTGGNPKNANQKDKQQRQCEDSVPLTHQNKKTTTATTTTTAELLGAAVPVYLNVYNLQQLDAGKKKSFNGHIGFGIYHSGVQVLNYEFSFGGAPGAPATTPGIFATPPRACLPPDQFHEQVLMGHIYGGMTIQDVQAVLIKMQPEWMAATYHLLSRNCNHFAEAFLKELSAAFHVEPKMKPPAYINRAARWGDVVIPDRVYKYLMDQVPQAPPEEEGGGGSNSGIGNKGAAAATSSSSSSSNNNPGYIPFSSHSSPQSHHHHHQHGNQATEESFDTEEDILAAIPIPTVEEMNIMSIREIKTVMWVHGISWEGCLEKSEIIKKVEEFQSRNEMSNTQRTFVQQQQQNQRPQNNNGNNNITNENFDNVVMSGEVVTSDEANNSNNNANRNRVVTGGRVVNVSTNNNTNNNNNNNSTSSPSSTFVNANPSAVASIVAMGFPDTTKVEDALRRTRNNIDRAVDLLLAES